MRGLGPRDLIRITVESEATDFFIADRGGLWLSVGGANAWEFDKAGVFTITDVLRIAQELDPNFDPQLSFHSQTVDVDGHAVRFVVRRRNSASISLTARVLPTQSSPGDA